MSELVLHTSGTTDEPKIVRHKWDYINLCADRSIKEIGLGSQDRVLDVFPANTIAHYTITAYPALKSGAQLHTAVFNAYEYLDLFNMIKPTYISLIPRHLQILKRTKGFSNLDMSCVRYMVTGSGKIEQDFIDTFRERGVQLVANWYGMTEVPPPVLVGYNSTRFDVNKKFSDDHIMFHPVTASSTLAECIINGVSTRDIFDMSTMEFHSRRDSADGKTWKTNF